MFLVFFSAVLVVLACLLVRRIQLGEMVTLKRDGHPLWQVQLRRCIEMRTHADGLGGFSFPEPAETRIVSWHICTLPVWSVRESIGLPASCESRIDELPAEEFDQHFTSSFRLTTQRTSSARRSHTAVA